MGLVFFNIALVLLGFGSIFVSSNTDRWIADEAQAFHSARCIARCQKDKTCRRQCRESPSKRIDLFTEDIGTTLPVAANFNATLHCKDIDVIRIKHNPGVWIIEQSTGHDDSRKDERTIRVSEEEVSSFANLAAGTRYRYKAFRVTSTGDITEPEVSPWFSTFDVDHRSEEIVHIEVASLELDGANRSRVRADIVFQPASDRTCHYDVISWSEEDGLAIGNFDSLHDFRFSLRNLGYQTNMTVLVSARNKGTLQGSNNASLTFVTPSCLQLHRNISVCAPDQVRGFRVSEIDQNDTDYNIAVEWDEPLFIPDNYTLQIQSLDYGSKDFQLATLPGNSTEAVLRIQMSEIDHRQRIISIIAESPGGASIPVSIHVSLDESLNFSFPTTTTSSNGKKSNSAFGDGIIAVPSVAIVALVLGIVYAYHLRGHSRCKRNDDKSYKYCRNLSDVKKNLDPFYGIGKVRNSDYEKKEPLMPKDCFEIRPAQLKIKSVLGSGVSGIVRLGCYQISQDHNVNVAVKMLKDDPSADDLKNFQHEIAIMKSAGHHRNIVSIIGCCTVNVPRPMLVVEYCSRGDLQTYLRSIWQEAISRAFERRARCKIAMQNDTMNIPSNGYENTANSKSAESGQVAITNKLYDIQEAYMLDTAEEEITVTDLLNIARQVASGMEFLSSNRIIHRDLAARNVLLCEDKTVKISDFGLSRDIYEENVYKKQGNSRLPLKWMAIEALTHQIYTTQSDVWSFGILLWEIVTLGCNPYPETPTNMVLQLLKTGYRMEKPENCGNELYDIMLSCWRTTAHSRPNFTQLKHQLDNLLRTASDNEYLNLYDLLREPNSRETVKLVKKTYSNLYSS